MVVTEKGTWSLAMGKTGHSRSTESNVRSSSLRHHRLAHPDSRALHPRQDAFSAWRSQVTEVSPGPQTSNRVDRHVYVTVAILLPIFRPSLPFSSSLSYVEAAHRISISVYRRKLARTQLFYAASRCHGAIGTGYPHPNSYMSARSPWPR